MSPTASAPYLMYGRYRIHSDVLTWKSLPNFLPFYQENPLVICGFPLQIGRNEQLKTVLVNSRLDKLWNKLSSFMSFKNHGTHAMSLKYRLVKAPTVKAINSDWPWEELEQMMMTSSNENIFRVTGHLCGEFTGLRWIPRTKASDGALMNSLICV